MKNKKNIKVGAGVVLSTAMLLGFASFAFAQAADQNQNTNTPVGSASTQTDTNTNTSLVQKNLRQRHNMGATSKADAKLKVNQSKEVDNANASIDKRVSDLNELATRVSDMKNISDAQRSVLSSSLQSQIAKLNALKDKIGTDSDMASLRADAKSITADNRTYALVVPQARIIAASDKATTVINMLTAMGTKLQTRISGVEATGKDVSKLNAALSDFNAKLADATSLSSSVVSGVAGLTPDEGNKTTLSANDTALKAARKNLAMIGADLAAARKDVKIITTGVKGVGADATSTSTNTTSATTTTSSVTQ